MATNDEKRTGLLVTHLSGSAFWAFLLLSCAPFLLPLLAQNEHDILPVARQFAQPDWLPTDWYLNLPIGYRYLFNVLITPLIAVAPLEYVAVLGRLFSFALFGLALSAVVKQLEVPTRFAVPFVWMFVNHQSLVADEWMVGGLETKPFSYFFVLIAIVFLLRKEYGRLMVALGLALSFHVLVGGYAAFAVAFTIVVNRKQFQPDLKEIVKKCWIAIVCGSNAILAIVKMVIDSRGVDSARAADIYVRYRVPAHVLPSSWESTYWPVYLAALVGAMSVAFIVSKRESDRVLSGFALGSAVLFGAGLVFWRLGAYSLLKFYWFRLGDVMLPLAGALGLAVICYRMASRLRYGQLWRHAFLVVSVLIVLVSAVQLGVAVKDRYRQDSAGYASLVEPGLLEPLTWIRMHTNRSSVFLVNPFTDMFYLVAERAMFVSFKSAPQSDRDILEWYRRIIFCNGGREPRTEAFHSFEEISRNFDQLDVSDLRKLHRLYRLDYYLTSRTHVLPDLPIAFANASYVLYSLAE